MGSLLFILLQFLRRGELAGCALQLFFWVGQAQTLPCWYRINIRSQAELAVVRETLRRGGELTSMGDQVSNKMSTLGPKRAGTPPLSVQMGQGRNHSVPCRQAWSLQRVTCGPCSNCDKRVCP